MKPSGGLREPKSEIRHLQAVQDRFRATHQEGRLPYHYQLLTLALCASLGSLSACGTVPGQAKPENPYSLIQLPQRAQMPVPLAPSEPEKSSTTTPKTPAGAAPTGVPSIR